MTARVEYSLRRRPRPSAVLRFHGESDDVHATLLFQSDQLKDLKAGNEFPDEPLTRRGRVLQEPVLEKRVVHYITRQVYFECDHGIFAEGGSYKEELHCGLNVVPSSAGKYLSDFKVDFSRGRAEAGELPRPWTSILDRVGVGKVTTGRQSSNRVWDGLILHKSWIAR